MRRLGILLLGLLCAGVAVRPASADDYPSKTVRIIVPLAPGGATDIVARLLAEQLRSSLGQSFVIENKVGANGMLALEELARSKPDGYTLMVGNVSTNAITPTFNADKLTFDPSKALVTVARLAIIPSFLVATTTGGFDVKTVQELVDYGKTNPGKLRNTSAGVASYPHFDTAIFAKKAGFESIHIPNKAGAAGMINDLVTGDVHWGVLNVASAASLVRAGKLRPLAVMTEERLPEYPDIPTLKEVGFPGVGTLGWQAMLAPGGTPSAVLEKLHGAMIGALESAPVKDAFTKQVIYASPTKSPADARAWSENERTHWKAAIAETGIRPD